jgi:hypothetical protein
MLSSDMIDELKQQAMERVTAVVDDPEARYALRVAFYDNYGGHYGNSELAFMRWEIDRGVLDMPPRGSYWWRAVNSNLMYDAELAALIHESGATVEVPVGARRWLDFIDDADEDTWYAAHNGSIAAGYLAQAAAASLESEGERLFMNIVLYRVLYAQAMVDGATFLGELGKLMANPILPAVDIITDVRDFYPRHYPLSRQDVRNLKGRGDGIMDLAVRLFDEDLILPDANRVYHHAAETLHMPLLLDLLRNGKPIYPAL